MSKIEVTRIPETATLLFLRELYQKEVSAAESRMLKYKKTTRKRVPKCSRIVRERDCYEWTKI